MLYFLYRLGIGFVHCAPKRLVDFTARAIVYLFFLFGRKKREMVCKNIETITGISDRKIIRKIALKNYVNFGLNIADYMRFFNRNEWLFNRFVDYSGVKERLQALSSQGNGVVVIAAHIGNWELAGFMAGFLGFKPHGIGLPQSDTKVEKLYKRIRGSWNIEVHPFNGGLISVYKALKRNEFATIVSDRDINHDGVKIDFFGKCITFPKGAATLAYRTGAKSVFGYLVRINGKYKTILSPEIGIDRTLNEDESITKYIQTVATMLESAIKEFPEQWFQFFDYFKEFQCL